MSGGTIHVGNKNLKISSLDLHILAKKFFYWRVKAIFDINETFLCYLLTAYILMADLSGEEKTLLFYMIQIINDTF